jgi:chemotaxis protein methyltransferase CheR
MEREFPYTRGDFEFLRKVASDRTGIVISEDKFNMFYARLSRRVRELRLSSFKEYCDYLQEERADKETLELINAITTNQTAFFRENHHFEYLSQKVIPELSRRNSNTGKIRIWSAGCSTGEEPYSISMVLHESVLLEEDWDVGISASDVDSSALDRASRGVYPEERIVGIKRRRLHRWFLKGKGVQQGMVCLKPEVRSLIVFSLLNLTEDWVLPEPMDVIFCRNVIIYFDKETKAKLIDRFANALKTGGYLFLGHSESLFQVTDRFELVGNTIYKKKG